jgi:hypothetical protein
MATCYEPCLTDRVEEYLWDKFPCDERVTDAGQRQIAEIIAKEEDASARRVLANQVVEFLAVCRGVPVQNVVQELKDLYSHTRGRQLCRWQAKHREVVREDRRSNQKVMAMAG